MVVLTPADLWSLFGEEGGGGVELVFYQLDIMPIGRIYPLPINTPTDICPPWDNCWHAVYNTNTLEKVGKKS